MNLETISALDAKNNFGDTIRKAQCSPIHITKHGKAIAVVMSIEDYEATEDLKLRFLQESITEGLKDLDNEQVADADRFFNDLEAGKFD
jgi:prevent-host-death family protein